MGGRFKRVKTNQKRKGKGCLRISKGKEKIDSLRVDISYLNIDSILILFIYINLYKN